MIYIKKEFETEGLFLLDFSLFLSMWRVVDLKIDDIETKGCMDGVVF